MSVYSSGEWHVKPGREEEFVRAWRGLAEESGQQHASNRWSFILRDQQDAGHFRSLAVWDDMQEASSWRSGDMYRRRTEALADMVERVDISVFEMVESVGAVPQAMMAAASRY